MVEKFKKSNDKENDFTKKELQEIADKVGADYEKQDKKSILVNEINQKLAEQEKPQPSDAHKLMEKAQNLTDKYCKDMQEVEKELIQSGRRAWSSRVKKVRNDLERKSRRGLKV